MTEFDPTDYRSDINDKLSHISSQFMELAVAAKPQHWKVNPRHTALTLEVQPMFPRYTQADPPPEMSDRMTNPLLETLPEPTAEQMESIRQEHESFLSDLEVAAVKALATGDWGMVESCLFFYNPETKAYDV